MDRDFFLANARNRYMQHRRVVCTGNPDRSGTLANGFKKIFPDAVFLCRSTGWDLMDRSDAQQSRLAKVFSNSNTFLNCSFIAPGIQKWLLEVCNQSVKLCDVVNIGSTHEYDNLGHTLYQQSKIELRTTSLALNTFRFRTCHCILGGIKTDDSDTKKTWLDIDLICAEIAQVWNKPYTQPLMSMDQHKKPW